jgi:glycosyltransferase 2 family protein
MNPRWKKVLKFVIRWGIAVGGIWWVIANMSLRDSVLVVDAATNRPYRASLARHAEENAPQFQIIDPQTKQVQFISASQVINPASRQKLEIWVGQAKQKADLMGMRLAGDINRDPRVQRLLIRPEGADRGVWIDPGDVVNGFRLDVPRPRVEVGLASMVQRASPWLLVAALAVFPLTFLITGYRWNKLLEAVDVRMGLSRALVINMVGAFYNSFMPGTTGGDVLKAYYASKHTPHRIRAVVSVFFDRLLGLLALVMVGGVMAAYQYLRSPSANDPTARACLQVAWAAIAVMIAVAVTFAVLFQPTVRKWLGLEYILNRLPAQKHIENAREVTRIYRRKPLLMLWALIVTIPVHLTVIVSAMLAGMAFDLPIRPLFYFTAVPVIVLVGSIPISPQGAGVMEFFAIALTQKQGATVSQAFALTMSIRMVQILWNLTGGLFVLHGGYRVPTEREQREMQAVGEEECAGDGEGETRGQGDKGTRGEEKRELPPRQDRPERGEAGARV